MTSRKIKETKNMLGRIPELPQDADPDVALVEEKQLEAEYQNVLKLDPQNEEGVYTEEFKKWLEWRRKFDYLTLQDGSKSKKEKKIERVRKIAFQLSLLWGYHEIILASNNEGANEIHGWLQDNFDDYEDLIDAYVLDLASYYAKKHYKPEAIKLIDNINPKELFITKLTLVREIEMKSYPGITFKQAIMLSRRPLEEAVTWIKNYEDDIDGFDTRVSYAPANMALLGFCLYDLPVFIILHAPGKSEAIYDAKMNADDIKDTMNDIRDIIIHHHRSSKKPLEDELDKVTRDYLQAERKYSLLIQEVERRTPADIMTALYKKERLVSTTSERFGWKEGLIILLVIACIGLLGFIVFFMVTNSLGGYSAFTNSTGLG